MVRFIIIWFIYSRTILPSIYIPIWLDLLSVYRQKDQNQITNLHSNMVRFIIRWTNDSRRFDNDIYIPIWLDLLFYCWHTIVMQHRYLHSNMVRFIIYEGTLYSARIMGFTFQYG